MLVWVLVISPAAVLISCLVNARQRKPITLLRMGASSCLIVAGLIVDWWSKGDDSIIGVHGVFEVLTLLVAFIASVCLGMYLALRYFPIKS